MTFVEQLGALPWTALWGVLAVLASWKALSQAVADRGRVDPWMTATMHLFVLVGLASVGHVFQLSLRRGAHASVGLGVLFGMLFLQWFMSWLALRSKSLTLIATTHFLVESLFSGLLVLGWIAVAVAIYSMTRRDASNHIEAWIGLAMATCVLVALSQSVWTPGGVLASWITSLLPGALLGAWMLLLHVAVTATGPTAGLPDVLPSTRPLRIIIVFGLPVLGLGAIAAGGALHARYAAAREPRTKVAYLRLAHPLLLFGTVVTTALVGLGLWKLRSVADVKRWVRYGVKKNSLFL